MMTTPAPTSAPAGASAWVSIDLGAIRDNVAELARRAGSAQVMAVVKADAYGHGLVPAARAALAGGARWLGVAQLDEALALRAAGVDAPILTWLYSPGADLRAAVAAEVTVTVSSVPSLTAAVEAARSLGRVAEVQLKVDTGLARNGAIGMGWQELVGAAARARAEGAVAVTGVWSHFAWADAPDHPTVRAQQDRFVEACREVERAGITGFQRHLANSAATLTNPSAAFDLVRPGLAVYGYSPVPDHGAPADFGLREAMRVTARLALVKDVDAGQGVSYAHAYTTTRPTRLGLVPIGYADGIPRAASNIGPVSIAGQWHTVAGRVCMDQIVVDLGPDSTAGPGDEVVILGSSASGEPTAQEWADPIGTINYEIITRISSRLPRVYLGGET